MKKLYSTAVIAIVFVMLTISLEAQVPDFGVYKGGLELKSYKPSDSYSGNLIYDLGKWDIDSILDSGNPVIFDIFATWCDPCWTFHKSGILESIYEEKGWGGENKVAIFGVESSPETSEDELVSNRYNRDWVADTKYPMVNKKEIEELFNIVYYPDIVIICPDRSVIFIEERTKENILTLISQCNGLPSLSNDPKLLASTTLDDYFVCGDVKTSQIDVSVIVQNYGKMSLEDSIKFVVTDLNGREYDDTIIKVQLQPFEYQELSIGKMEGHIGDNKFYAKIDSPNDDISNDTLKVSVFVDNAPAFQLNANNMLRIEMDIDEIASEVGFAFRKGIPGGSPSEVFADANSSNSLAYVGINSLADNPAKTKFKKSYTVDETGCYYFVVVDGFGDGIVFRNPNGEARIISENTVHIPGDWGKGTIKVFDITKSTAVSEVTSIKDFLVFPNPANNMINISFTPGQSERATIVIANALGENVYKKTAVSKTGMINIDLSDFDSGIYLISMRLDNQFSTSKFTLIK